MDRELRDRWVAALRSGEYKQICGTLRSDFAFPNGEPGFCCLGVLREIEPRLKNYAEIEGEIGALPMRACTWMNDGRGGYPEHNFNQIADWIEENL